MKTTTFDFKEELLIEEIGKRKAKRILIQLPEGLKMEGPRLAAIAKKAGALAIVSADPCYGACDLATQDAKSLGVDLIVHYGHSQMLQQELASTIYVEARAKVSVKEAVKKAIPFLKDWRSIGLTTTVQHVDTLDEARNMLLKMGKSVMIGNTGRLKHAGQVTGCDYSNAKAISEAVDAFLFIGGGKFHAVGIALTTTKPTVIADPYEKRAFSVNDEARRLVKQRWASISEAKKAKEFGVLIGLKNGQRRLEEAVRIKKKLEKTRRNATLLAIKEITPEALMQFPRIDAFVNTACPRVSLDDAARFRKPIMSVNEVLVVLDELSWEELCRRGWFENLI